MTVRKGVRAGGEQFSVSYYVAAERYWQFAGQYADRKDALRADGRGIRARVRRIG